MSIPRGTRRVLFDAAVAGLCLLLSLLILAGLTDRVPSLRTGAAVSLVVVHTAALLWRRSRPWPAFFVNLVSAVAVAALAVPNVALGLAPVVALYSIASQTPLRRAAWGAAAALVALAVVQALNGFSEDASTVAGNVGVLGAAWLLGTFVRKRQEYVERLEERTRELEEAREELARRAVADERLRIARELHDVVAHNLSLIAVQSGVGEHVIDDNPAEARRSLAAVRDASRQALDDMRRVLGILRDTKEADLTSPPKLSDLEGLASRVSQAGPRVDVVTRGDAEPLAPGIELTAYRVVQESLTNVVRHAHASTVRVAVAYEEGALQVEVVDDGRGASGNGRGHGLVGMRERVELLGGTFEAGPLRDGGFRVAARIPTDATS